MIGRQLVKQLLNEGADILGVSLDSIDKKNFPEWNHIKFINGDLRNFDFCKKITQGKDMIFHVAGIKGSPMMTAKQPNTFFVNTSMFNLNMIESARLNKVSKFLYTSSIGVYSPESNYQEDSVWNSFPSPNDKFAGWAKRMGELQLEAARIEYGAPEIYIIRPANVYGPWDNFNPNNAMVIPSLISRIVSGENPLKVWGDGSSIRDFVHAEDVARAMIYAVMNGIHEPINVGSGVGISILEIVNILSKYTPKLKVEWDSTKPAGDKSRVLDMNKLFDFGFNLTIPLEEGIHDTLEWYRANKIQTQSRYNAFEEAKRK